MNDILNVSKNIWLKVHQICAILAAVAISIQNKFGLLLLLLFAIYLINYFKWIVSVTKNLCKKTG